MRAQHCRSSTNENPGYISYRPTPASESFNVSTPSYPHSITRLLGIQTELEEVERESKEDRMKELVESSEGNSVMMKAGDHGEKKTGYKIGRKSEKDIGQNNTDLIKVKVAIKTKIVVAS